MTDRHRTSGLRAPRSLSVHHSTRKAQIVDAAVSAAARRGYDEVHMRDIAMGAGVSLATVYHYFPSKVHLLMEALARELFRFDEHVTGDLAGITDDYERLRVALGRLVETMRASARITDALTHAYVAAQVAAAPEAELVRTQTTDMFVRFLAGRVDDAASRDVETAQVLTDVWTSEVLALVQGRRDYAQMQARLDNVVRLLAVRCSSPAKRPRCGSSESESDSGAGW